MDTIFALASAKGRAGVAVLRVSGPKAMESLWGLTGKAAFEPRKAHLAALKHPVSREILDQALVLSFPAPHSFTGEDVVEYHLHGGAAVIEGVLAALGMMDGHRVAEAGEFTRRAFTNGKMDLTEAEGLADLINAETQMQKAQAMAQMGGVLHHLYEGWKDRLARILAYVEADLEFPDEDLPEGILPRVLPEITALIQEIEGHLDDKRRGERLRAGVQIAVVGAPNAGKSSLVNLLAHREIAIVSDLAGTTRDVLETHLDIGGYPVILADTAGLRPDQIGNTGQEKIESEGIRRALQRAREADILVLVYDGTQSVLDPHTQALETYPQVILVLNKADQGLHVKHPKRAIVLSTVTGEGVQVLLEEIIHKIQGIIRISESPALTRARHRTSLQACVFALKRALDAPLPELAAEDIRLGVRELGRLTGKVDIEDLLDIVFRDFCIGK